MQAAGPRQSAALAPGRRSVLSTGTCWGPGKALGTSHTRKLRQRTWPTRGAGAGAQQAASWAHGQTRVAPWRSTFTSRARGLQAPPQALPPPEQLLPRSRRHKQPVTLGDRCVEDTALVGFRETCFQGSEMYHLLWPMEPEGIMLVTQSGHRGTLCASPPSELSVTATEMESVGVQVRASQCRMGTDFRFHDKNVGAVRPPSNAANAPPGACLGTWLARRPGGRT